MRSQTRRSFFYLSFLSLIKHPQLNFRPGPNRVLNTRHRMWELSPNHSQARSQGEK
uniref:Uncharacterized protein n=1 Tax=Proteus vulgaris TaxID=585 RepID=Q8KKB2_PROVU|nr:hypothetical protein [Proteus vulgaris]